MPAAGQLHGSASLEFPKSPSEMITSLPRWFCTISASSLQEELEFSLQPRILQQEAVSRPSCSQRHLKDWQVGLKVHAPLISVYSPCPSGRP